MSARELELDHEVRRFSLRLYFPADKPLDEIKDAVSDALQESAALCDLTAAYELVSDGFGGLTPNEEPLA